MVNLIQSSLDLRLGLMLDGSPLHALHMCPIHTGHVAQRFNLRKEFLRKLPKP
jgi:hypothetical protein